MHRTRGQSLRGDIFTEQSSGEEITTGKSENEITISPQVSNVKKMKKQQVSSLKVKCHNCKDILHKQINVTFF